MNVIARLEFELPRYDFADNRFNHYTTRTPPYIYVCVCACVCVGKREREREREREKVRVCKWVKKKWTESDRMHVEKIKREETYLRVCLFAKAFRLQGFVWRKKYFIQIIFVWEIIMIDNFFKFSWKSSSELVDVAMWKKRNNTGWYVLPFPTPIYIYIYIRGWVKT